MDVSALIRLLIFAVIIFGCYSIFRAYLGIRREARLRENPSSYSVVEVRLPRDIIDANKRMQGFYRRVAADLAADPGARKLGQGQIHMVYYADVPTGTTTPQLRFLVYCPPELLTTIKLKLRQSFQGAEIVIPEQDPMAKIAELIKSKEEDGETPTPETSAISPGRDRSNA